MIAVIDFGGGNLGSLCAALTRRGATFEVTGDPAVVANASAAILPGDGAFGTTMDALAARGLDDAIRSLLAARKPFLGICVGMQLLYERSSEHGTHEGFGVFRGEISRLSRAPRVPHMGWNQLEIVGKHSFVDGVAEGSYAYFLHSYCAGVTDATVAACEYGERFAAVVARDHVMGTQFHPEKSQSTGALLLDNFLRLTTGGLRAEAVR